MARTFAQHLLAASLAIGLAAPMVGGCVVQTRGAVVVDAPPPPPRYVQAEARPGHVWVQGYWVHRGGDWHWNDGHYVEARPGYRYVSGQWIKRAGRWHWVEGRWEASARSRVRDHRSPPRADRSPVVRDHRSPRRAPAVRDNRSRRSVTPAAVRRRTPKPDVRTRDHRSD